MCVHTYTHVGKYILIEHTQTKAKEYTLYCLERWPMGKGGKREWAMEVKERKGREKEEETERADSRGACVNR